jgi:hypothetical protein
MADLGQDNGAGESADGFPVASIQQLPALGRPPFHRIDENVGVDKNRSAAQDVRELH